MPVRAGPTGSDPAWRVSAPEEKPTKPFDAGQLLLATDWLDIEFVQKGKQPGLIVKMVRREPNSLLLQHFEQSSINKHDLASTLSASRA